MDLKEAKSLIAPYLRFVDEKSVFDEPPPPDKQFHVDNQTSGKRVPHQFMTSHRVRELLHAGWRDPFKIIVKIVEEIQAGKCKPVKNLLVLRHVLSQERQALLGPQPREKKNILFAKLRKFSKECGLPYAAPEKLRIPRIGKPRGPKLLGNKAPADSCATCHHPRVEHRDLANRCYHISLPEGNKCVCKYFRTRSKR